MKKKCLIISISVLLVLSICLYVFIGNNNEKVIFENESSTNHIVNTNALTMMYETDYDSGEYQVSSDTTWPGDEYIFNETLSKCENGGILSWNNDTKKIVMQTNISDRCYIYFDKYNMPQITNVKATEVTSDSIMVSVTASSGDGGIVSYHYSIGNGEYILSNSSTHIFENLDAETSYNISVYVSDSNERNSNVYNVDVTTLSSLISFTITDTFTTTTKTYYAEEGMTFKQWLNSTYNDGLCEEICPGADGYTGIVCGGSSLNAQDDDIINNNNSYSYNSGLDFTPEVCPKPPPPVL